MKGKKTAKENTKVKCTEFLGVWITPDLMRRVTALGERLDRPLGWVMKDALNNYGPLKEVV